MSRNIIQYEAETELPSHWFFVFRIKSKGTPDDDRAHVQRLLERCRSQQEANKNDKGRIKRRSVAEALSMKEARQQPNSSRCINEKVLASKDAGRQPNIHKVPFVVYSVLMSFVEGVQTHVRLAKNSRSHAGSYRNRPLRLMNLRQRERERHELSSNSSAVLLHQWPENGDHSQGRHIAIAMGESETLTLQTPGVWDFQK